LNADTSQSQPHGGGARALLQVMWRQSLWAVPFAVFFWAMFSSWTLAGLWRSFQVSLVFAYTIGFALWIVQYVVLARLRRGSRSAGSWVLIESATYMSGVLTAAYIAATINHLWVLPGFLGSTRAVVINGLFSLLFAALFGGIGYAIHFYRESLHRARMVEQMRAELASAELRALRAQIHPHFLFKTLNTIATLITVNPAEAEDTTTRLADIFRYVLTASSRDAVPLGEELEFMRDVLHIERVRFGDRLRIEESIEPGVERAMVPSLLLQPIVENAVKYGVSNRAEGGTVGIAARREHDSIVLEVRDDGPGMREASAPAGTGFGLSSVRDRLRAAGLEDALVIESSPGRGTCVRIRLPFTEHTTPKEGASS
jgi:signal transduction histidine kinase